MVLANPTIDAVLIDGDHNFFTVRNELELVWAGVRDRAGRLPVVMFHDVGWPYARRDLYYEPGDIPVDERQPHARSGIARDRAELTWTGMNANLENALDEQS